MLLQLLLLLMSCLPVHMPIVPCTTMHYDGRIVVRRKQVIISENRCKTLGKRHDAC